VNKRLLKRNTPNAFIGARHALLTKPSKQTQQRAISQPGTLGHVTSRGESGERGRGGALVVVVVEFESSRFC
jgi:hypothetical protein